MKELNPQAMIFVREAAELRERYAQKSLGVTQTKVTILMQLYLQQVVQWPCQGKDGVPGNAGIRR